MGEGRRDRVLSRRRRSSPRFSVARSRSAKPFRCDPSSRSAQVQQDLPVREARLCSIDAHLSSNPAWRQPPFARHACSRFDPAGRAGGPSPSPNTRPAAGCPKTGNLQAGHRDLKPFDVAQFGLAPLRSCHSRPERNGLRDDGGGGGAARGNGDGERPTADDGSKTRIAELWPVDKTNGNTAAGAAALKAFAASSSKAPTARAALVRSSGY